MIDKITITTNISEKTTKFFGCNEIDTLTFTKIDDYFILSLGCTEVVVTNLKITSSIVEFINTDEGGENLLQFQNGVLTICEKDDKLLQYLIDTTKRWFIHLGWSLPKILQ